MASLKDVIESLGYPMLDVIAAPRGTEVEVTGISVNDPLEPPDDLGGHLVLGIGLSPGRDASEALSALGAAGAAGLIVKAPHGTGRLAEDAALAGVALLAVSPGASWVQVILLLSSVVSRLSFGAPEERLSGAEAGDLFAVANVVAEHVGAPVTIEDPQSRVLAFSTGQEEADTMRAQTILGRQVPTTWQRRLQEMGVFRRLANERGPLYIRDVAPEVMPRVAIAVRAGNELLGSIWASVKEPLSAEREREMIELANFVALHLLRHRLGSDVESSLEAELVVTVLKGGALALQAAHRLGLSAGTFRVIAVSPRGSVGAPEQSIATVRKLIGLHLWTANRQAPCAAVAGIVYAIVPVAAKGDWSLKDLRVAAERLRERARARLSLDLLVGIGVAVDQVEAIPKSRETADQALRVLHTNGGRCVAEIGDVRSSALLLRFADACADDPALKSGPIARLHSYDRDHKTEYVPTLRAYLDSFGDANEAARLLEVHPNTIRYRLRQVQTVLGVDLADRAERLVMLLELQLAGRAEPTSRVVQ